MLLVTGGSGFIGSAFILGWLKAHDEPVANLDALTYAGHQANLLAVSGDARYAFHRGDIGDRMAVRRLLAASSPRAIVHFAAETHVDRSIGTPLEVGETNAMGTLLLLEEVRAYWQGLPRAEAEAFRFLHVSTDEVFGSLAPTAPAFREDDAARPNSPYAASKAASDHFVRAYHRTYGLPALVTHCSNNYGPRQFPEKLIPRFIHQALRGEPLPIYGDGLQVRDWLYVDDHCAALRTVLARARPGDSFNIGGGQQRSNLALVQTVCAILNEFEPRTGGVSYAELMAHVADRPGHDRRYAVDITRIGRELGWTPVTPLEDGLRHTVRWYLENRDWTRTVLEEARRRGTMPTGHS